MKSFEFIERMSVIFVEHVLFKIAKKKNKTKNIKTS